jgi:hypothetical protein
MKKIFIKKEQIQVFCLITEMHLGHRGKGDVFYN